MSKLANPAKIASSGKEFPGRGAGYRDIGIAAVAAALRCQHLPAPEDERVASYAPHPSHPDRVR